MDFSSSDSSSFSTEPSTATYFAITLKEPLQPAGQGEGADKAPKVQLKLTIAYIHMLEPLPAEMASLDRPKSPNPS